MIKPYYQDKYSTIYHGDCLEIMPELEPVDLILTDPQFFLPPVGHGTRGRESEFCGSLGDLLMLENAYTKAFDEFKRLLKVTGQLYVNCHDRSYPSFFRLAYTRWPRVDAIIWYKPTGRVGSGWRKAHEILLHGATPETIYSIGFRQDVVGIMPVRTLNRQHPAEKPIDLGGFIMEVVPMPGTTLDPYMGSGSYLISAKVSGFKAIGIEIEEKYCEIAVRKLSQEVLEFG